jgi:hypothetical protein
MNVIYSSHAEYNNFSKFQVFAPAKREMTEK